MMNEETRQYLLSLEERIKTLENERTYGQSNYPFMEFIRDIVVFDQDTTSTRAQFIGGVAAPLVPDRYLRVYFKGKPYNLYAKDL